MRIRCWVNYELIQGRRETIKFAAWGVQSQGRNLMELAGVHYKGWMLRFNWMKRQIFYQNRQQDDGQSKGLT